MARMIMHKANPNRHGWVKLVKFYQEDLGVDSDDVFVVVTPWDEDGSEFDGDYNAAKKFFDETVAELAEAPNFEAQAEYDAMHGTDNGYSHFQYNREQ